MKKRNVYKWSAMLFAVLCAGAVLIHGNLGMAAKKGGIRFSKSVKKLEAGETFTFRVQGVKNDGKAVKWSSSNSKIANISKKGTVTAVKAGTVRVTAVLKKSGQSISQKLVITKKANPQKEENQNTEPEKETPSENILIGGDGDKKDTDSYQEQEVENAFVKNLSKTAQTIENAGFDSIGFADCRDINRFSYEVFGKAAAGEEENPVVSPLSAYLALALVAEGAEGETKAEFDALLGNDMLSTRIHQLTESLSKVSGNTKLSIADSVWLDDQFEADASWLSRMVSFYEAEIYESNLCTDAARQGMNHWVSNRTKGLIPSLFDQNLSEDARLVLMNTIYLKAKWQSVFDANDTYKREFTNADKENITTDFMNQYSVNHRYFKTEEADGVVLPYDDGKLVMIAIRPQAGQTAKELAGSLTEEKVNGYVKDARSTYMNLHLPKYTMEYSVTMNDILKQLGLVRAFNSETAEFGGLGKTKGAAAEPLFIDTVLQKVKVQVDEEGTEAAAVTAIIMECGAALDPDREQPIEVDFNEPFVYLIADTKTPFGEGNVLPLFLGVVTELGGEN